MQGTPKILLKDQQQLIEQDMVQDMNRNYTGSLINMTEVRQFSEVAEKKKLTPPAEELQHILPSPWLFQSELSCPPPEVVLPFL